MDDTLCLYEWNGQLWPAKILRSAAQQCRRKNCVEIEILGEKKRLLVQRVDTVPLTKQKIDTIARQRGHAATKIQSLTKELKYRKALRLALDLFGKIDSRSSPKRESLRRSVRHNLSTPQLSNGRKRGSRDTRKPASCVSGSQQSPQRDSVVVPVTAADRCQRRGEFKRGTLQMQADLNSQPESPSGPHRSPEKRPRRKRKETERKGTAPGSKSDENSQVPWCGHVERPGQNKRRKGQWGRLEPGDGVGADVKPERGREGKQDRWHDDGDDMGAVRDRAGAKDEETPAKTHSRKYKASGGRALVRGVAAPTELSSAMTGCTRKKTRVIKSELAGSHRKGRTSPICLATSTPNKNSAQWTLSSSELETPQWRASSKPCQLFNSSVGEEEQQRSPSEAVLGSDKRGARGQRWYQKPLAEPVSPEVKEEKQFCPDAIPTIKSTKADASCAEPGIVSPQSVGASVGALSPSDMEGYTGEASWSSDLSIDLSLQEDPTTLNSSLLQEEGEEQEEEELPSFLLQTDKKPLAIKMGNCVWYKWKKYPYWPAIVKGINHKKKKASVIFIDPMLYPNQKGFTTPMKNLVPFDSELKDQLVAKAKEEYRADINWCLELIQDYRFRIACGSFSGSFLEYYADDISCPVRRMYRPGASDVAFPSKQIMEEQGDLVCINSENASPDIQSDHLVKKLLPDRSKAARNLANGKLVQFIVDKRGVEKHLQAIISGQESSKWLMALLKSSRTVDLCKTYLEDEEQVDQVYRYLEDMLKNASQTDPCLAKVDVVRLILDVLFPEAVVHAIAGVFKITLEKAEDLYLEGPYLSKREHEAFDRTIEQQLMAESSVAQCPAC